MSTCTCNTRSVCGNMSRSAEALGETRASTQLVGRFSRACCGLHRWMARHGRNNKHAGKEKKRKASGADPDCPLIRFLLDMLFSGNIREKRFLVELITDLKTSRTMWARQTVGCPCMRLPKGKKPHCSGLIRTS